jgi:hypothetical protein
MKRIILMAGTVVTALCLVVAVGFTQEDAEKKGACRPDVQKFCKDVKPGGGRIWSCLKSHEGEMSQACKDHMAKKRENMKEFMSSCKADAQKLCKDVPRGQGHVIHCLKGKMNELSNPCKAFLTKN